MGSTPTPGTIFFFAFSRLARFDSEDFDRSSFDVLLTVPKFVPTCDCDSVKTVHDQVYVIRAFIRQPATNGYRGSGHLHHSLPLSFSSHKWKFKSKKKNYDG